MTVGPGLLYYAACMQSRYDAILISSSVRLSICQILVSHISVSFTAQWRYHHFAPFRPCWGATSVSVSVCPLAYLKNCTFKLHEIFRTLPVAVDRSFSDDNAIRYVFPVFCMTSCFHIRHVAKRAYSHSDSPGGKRGTKS